MIKKMFLVFLATALYFGLNALFQYADKDTARADSWYQQQNNYTNVTSNGTGFIKSTGAYLHSVTINKPAASGVFQISDSNNGSAVVPIATITEPGSLLSSGPVTAIYDVQSVNGLTYYSTAAAMDVTIAWR